VTQKIPLVAVVDDDESVRESLPDLLREFGFAARAYTSAEDFLASADLGRTACLLLDVAMSSMTGPELLRELRRRGKDTPVVFITAHGDRPSLVEEGAVECLFKPFSETALLAALKSALGIA
jgi:FixJ family two-component response regulator